MPNRQRGRGRGSLKIPSVQGLEGTALFYLGRYAASEASLRRVLQNRLQRAARANAAFAADEALQQKLREAIEAIVVKHRKSGVLNDAAFAEMKTTGMRRAGRSARVIRMKLGQKGVARAAVEQALNLAAEGDSDEAELQAALALARRKKLGPFRQKPAVVDQHRKDLATLARAGFSFDIAKRALASGE
jgi:regulatory protein